MRWIEILAKTPSGKTQFTCKYCGRTSPTPDKTCPTPPFQPVVMQANKPLVFESCAEIEDRELKLRTHPVLKNLLLTTKDICRKISGRGTTGSKHRTLREHREVTRRYIQHAVYMELKDEPFQNRHKVWDVIDSLRDELWKV